MKRDETNPGDRERNKEKREMEEELPRVERSIAPVDSSHIHVRIVGLYSLESV